MLGQERVYVGFSPVDSARAKQICRLLHAEGYKVLPTEHRVSSPRHHKRNVQRLEQADIVITLVSPEALNSPYIWREVAMANTLKLPLVPLVVEPLTQDLPLVGAFDATMRDESFYRDALLARLRKSRGRRAQHNTKTSTQLVRELERREQRKLRSLGRRIHPRQQQNNTQLRIALATATALVCALAAALQFTL